MEEYSYYKT